MARQGKTASRAARAKKAVKTVAKKVTSRPRSRRREEQKAEPAVSKSRPRGDGKAARPAVIKPDIPLEVLDRTYTPKQTSIKGPFRASGDDHQRDQELAGGYVDEGWSDEDRFTNKSGDPRIGTHHHKYEPGE